MSIRPFCPPLSFCPCFASAPRVAAAGSRGSSRNAGLAVHVKQQSTPQLVNDRHASSNGIPSSPVSFTAGSLFLSPNTSRLHAQARGWACKGDRKVIEKREREVRQQRERNIWYRERERDWREIADVAALHIFHLLGSDLVSFFDFCMQLIVCARERCRKQISSTSLRMGEKLARERRQTRNAQIYRGARKQGLAATLSPFRAVSAFKPLDPAVP